MEIISKVFQFSNVVMGVPPLLLLFFIVREVYFAAKSPGNRIDWEKVPFDEVWKKARRFCRVFLFWALAALVIDVFTRDNLAMITVLQVYLVYVVTELPHLFAHAFLKLFGRFMSIHPIGIEILYDRCKLFHSDRKESSNYQTFAYSFFARALKDPGISHLYNKLWLNRGLSKKQKEFQDIIAQQMLDLCIEEFHRPLPENVSRDDWRRSLNNKKLLDVLVKRKVFGAKNKWIATNSLYQRLLTEDEESVNEIFRGLLDNEPNYDYGQLSLEQQQLLLFWFKIPIQPRRTYEADYDADLETDPETINKQRRQKVKRPMPKLYGRTDYSFGLVGFLKRLWNRLNSSKRQNRKLNTTKKPLAKAVIKEKPLNNTRPKSGVSSTERQDIVNKATKETLSSTILPVPYTAAFELVNVISTNDLSATSDDKDAGDNLPELEFTSKIPIRKPEMVRNRTVTRKGPEELQVSPSAGMTPPVAAAVKSSGNFAPKPFKAKPVPASTYKPPSTINKDRRTVKQNLPQRKVIAAKPATDKDEPKQFRAKPAPPSTYKPTLYPFLVNSRSKRS